MRLALPLLYCVDDQTRIKLAGMLDDAESYPTNWWREWLSSEAKQAIEDYERMRRIDKFMRQAPSRSRE